MKKFFKKVSWVIKELIKIYSNEPSYFSKKRIESGIAFVIAQYGMVYFLIENHSRFSMQDLMMWAGAEFVVAGYMISQIQLEKKKDRPS